MRRDEALWPWPSKALITPFKCLRQVFTWSFQDDVLVYSGRKFEIFLWLLFIASGILSAVTARSWPSPDSYRAWGISTSRVPHTIRLNIYELQIKLAKLLNEICPILPCRQLHLQKDKILFKYVKLCFFYDWKPRAIKNNCFPYYFACLGILVKSQKYYI
jgi:hypothetical protein